LRPNSTKSRKGVFGFGLSLIKEKAIFEWILSEIF
jgi:hypothetical protein